MPFTPLISSANAGVPENHNTFINYLIKLQGPCRIEFVLLFIELTN